MSLTDTETGETVALEDPYGFHHHGSSSKMSDPTQRPALVASSVGQARLFQLHISTPTTTSLGHESMLPSAVSLAQNYPNPFNPSTTMRFALPESMQVSLEVFDLMGRKVASVISVHTYPAGHYQVHFDASHLASGSYIYRLSTTTTSITKKLLLIK